MNAPPLLLAAALLFWGWQTSLFAAALPLALVLEGHRLAPWRMDLTERDFSRLWRACAVLFLLVMGLVYLTNRSYALRVFQWAPVLFFPIVAAQAFSTSPRIDSRVFFLWIRTEPFNLAYPYALLAVGAACAAPERALGFFPVLAVLTGWMLWGSRPARASVPLWFLLFAIVAAAGFIGAVSLRDLQKKVENYFIEALQEEIDTTNVRTAIGDIGKRKESNAILFRAKALPPTKEPLHLRSTGYNVYHDGSWFAMKAPMNRAVAADGGWTLGTGTPSAEEVEISMSLRNGRGYLLAPDRARAVRGLAAESLSISRLGAIDVEGGPGLAVYRMLRAADLRSFPGPPDATDLSVPNEEALAVAQIVDELRLASLPTSVALDRLQRFFEDRFVYTLDLKTGKDGGTPLANFLLRTRAGHCEYFATAATLLLRKAGVPARYTVGYLANDYSALEDAFVVRSRDAHAWVSVYLDGAWQTFDPTPPNWIAEDRKQAGPFASLTDLWSFVSFRFARWRWSDQGGIASYRPYGIAAVLALLLAWFWKRRKGLRRQAAPTQKAAVLASRSGSDSPLFAVERALQATAWERRPGETGAAWFGRINGQGGLSTEGLGNALALHLRYRFDPRGITEEERRVLARDVEAWLKEAQALLQGNGTMMRAAGGDASTGGGEG